MEQLSLVVLAVALLGWLPLGFLVVLVYSLYWMILSHLIPVRCFLPITLIGFNTGQLTTVGLRGVQTISREVNESMYGILIGFTGIVINFFYLSRDMTEASAPFFCLGTALVAYEKVNAF